MIQLLEVLRIDMFNDLDHGNEIQLGQGFELKIGLQDAATVKLYRLVMLTLEH